MYFPEFFNFFQKINLKFKNHQLFNSDELKSATKVTQQNKRVDMTIFEYGEL
jgi:hypothetical protein